MCGEEIRKVAEDFASDRKQVTPKENLLTPPQIQLSIISLLQSNYICILLSLSFFLSLPLSLCLSLYLYIYRSIHLFINQSIHITIYNIYLCLCLSTYLSAICLGDFIARQDNVVKCKVISFLHHLIKLSNATLHKTISRQGKRPCPRNARTI